MFVDITTPKKPLEAEKIYNKCYRQGEEITPAVCFEVLKSTNYAACIKRMLLCVERLPKEKQGACKEVVLATFTNREQPEEVVAVGERLAVVSGYAKEFDAVKGKIDEVHQLYIKSSVEYKVYEVFAGSDYTEYDFSGCARAIFTNKAVNLREAKNLPEDLDVSMCDGVNLMDCDLSEVKSLEFKDGATAYLEGAENLPADLDVSMCDVVDLRRCDLSEVKSLKFKAGKRVYLSAAENLPADLDISMCDYVYLSSCDLSEVKSLKFKAGAKVDLEEAKNLPVDLDVSMCDVVVLSGCDLSPVKSLKFKAGAEVGLYRVKKPPEVLDVSQCRLPYMGDGNFAGAKMIVFKDLDQMTISQINLSEDAPVKIVYKDSFPKRWYKFIGKER